VKVLHSVKYDGLTRDMDEEALRKRRLIQSGFMAEGDVILLGSSTWPGEETALVKAFLAIREDVPTLRLVLVPRHAERRRDVLSELESLNVTVACWSDASDQILANAEVLMVDTTGELKHFTGIADRVFVGKSLFRPEGQNPLEAAFAGKWICTGPGMSNFRTILEDLHEAEAVMQVQDEDELEMALRCSLEDREVADLQGERAAKRVLTRQGSLSASADELTRLIGNPTLGAS
jgi:3-deoxy-D-manno-octulosonic-acid transferase